jgi:hypothetical protein
VPVLGQQYELGVQGAVGNDHVTYDGPQVLTKGLSVLARIDLVDGHGVTVFSLDNLCGLAKQRVVLQREKTVDRRNKTDAIQPNLVVPRTSLFVFGPCFLLTLFVAKECTAATRTRIQLVFVVFLGVARHAPAVGKQLKCIQTVALKESCVKLGSVFGLFWRQKVAFWVFVSHLCSKVFVVGVFFCYFWSW